MRFAILSGFKALIGIGLLGVAPSASALEALYLGGQLGHVALTQDPARSFVNSLGFGADIGLRTNARVDLTLSFLTSTHSGPGDLTIYAPFASADFHVAQAYDFDFTVGVGPGFYNFKNAIVSDTRFGLNFGGAVDVILDDHVRVGLGSRYHAALGASGISGNFWTVTMRVGYLFTME